MSRLHSWTKVVHAHVLKEGPTPIRQIQKLFGEPEGTRSSLVRMSEAAIKGYFSKEGERHKAVYTAVPKNYSALRWTPELDALLAKEWPKRGERCIKQFPGFTVSALRKRAETLRIRLSLTLKRARRKKREAEVAKTLDRNPKSSFGYVREGAVKSIFDLGQRI
jgi:hypothetical protein